ncbi:MAG: M23 family peptidase, partial [Candidatus Zixiibacteriota bacterium]
MSKLTKLILILLVTAFTAGRSAELTWPVKREIDIASGFGDYRNGRFHAGVDIRTGGVIGEAVYAPVDGYVWRIRTNFEGYG